MATLVGVGASTIGRIGSWENNEHWEHVIDAYSRSIQGFFIKPASYAKLRHIMPLVRQI